MKHNTVWPRLVLALCCLGMMVMSFSVNASALCLTAIAGEFHFDEAASGFFLSCTFWGFVLGILLSGAVADRWGARALLGASGGFQAAGFLILGFAPTPTWLYAGATMCGLGSGIADALFSPLVCVLFPHARTRVSNVLHTFYPAGTVVIGILVLFFFGRGWAWRSIFRMLAIISLPYATGFLLIALPKQFHLGESRLSVKEMLSSLSFYLLLGGIFLAGVTELGPSSWLPAFVENAAGGTRSAGTMGLLIFAATMTAGRFANSYLIPKMNLRWFFLGSGLLCAASLILASVPGPAWFSILCLSVMGLGVAGFWPTILACAGDVFPRGGASMFSLLGATGNLGGVAGPLAIGLVAQHSSLHTAMATLVVAPLLLAGILLGLLVRKRRA